MKENKVKKKWIPAQGRKDRIADSVCLSGLEPESETT